MQLELVIAYSLILFMIGLIGLVIHGKHLIGVLMSVELLLLAANTLILAFARSHNSLEGDILVFFILTVAAAETAIGLAIFVVISRQKECIDVHELNELGESKC